jgi:hypothetical protein
MVEELGGGGSVSLAHVKGNVVVTAVSQQGERGRRCRERERERGAGRG